MKEKNSKLGVVITDGVGYRNFILSDFINEALKSFDDVVILSFLPTEVYKGKVECKIIELNTFQETFKTWAFRKAKEVSHLHLHKKNNFGIQDNLRSNYNRNKSVRGFLTRFIIKWTSLFNNESWISLYTKLQQLSFRKNIISKEYCDLLADERIDCLFFTHQRPPYIAPLAYAAKQLGIRHVSFIFSWDNLASKGRMAASFDGYLVWSNLMKDELMLFYSRIKEADIEVVGTPQFEPYVLDRYRMDVHEFYRRFKVNAQLKTVCFSCGDISTSKNDELYIETIAESILNNEIESINLVVRTSPAEAPIRFKHLKEKYAFIIWNYPDWKLSRENHQEEWSQRVPSSQDVSDLRALLEFCDLNINMLSTMSLDFMQFDKPVINPVFGNLENDLYNDQRFLKYAHIEHIIKSGATRIVKNKEELIDSINIYLNEPDLDRQNRRELFEQQIGCSLEGTGKRIVNVLLKSK